MIPLKSLAHPNWPYEGSAHEWRGFVKKSEGGLESDKARFDSFDAVYQKQKTEAATAAHGGCFDFSKSPSWQPAQTVYQKQNLGPELK